MRKKAAVRLFLVSVGLLVAARAYGQTGQMLDEYGGSPKSIAMGQALAARSEEHTSELQSR